MASSLRDAHNGIVRLQWFVLLAVLAGCGGSPTSPGSRDTPAPDIVKLGPHLIMIEHHPTTPFCGIPTGTGGTVIVTRVTVSWSGSGWTATPTTSASGDVQMFLRPVGDATASSLTVNGTISGTAIHLPELFVGVPPWNAQVRFPAGGQVRLTGLATAAVGGAYTEIRGSGAGSATVTDGAAVVCPGTSIAWTMVPEFSG